MKFINSSLRKEIDLKARKINGDIGKYLGRMENQYKQVKGMGDVYSFWIENPELRESLLKGKNSPQAIKKMAREGIANINNAWYYLTDLKINDNFVNELNEGVVKKVNRLIEPKRNSGEEYRNKLVTLNIEGYLPPSFLDGKIERKMKGLLEKVKEHYLVDPIEAAIMFHLEQAAIQPFLHANKRTARLVQDRILYGELLPPVVIPAGEGKFYLDLLVRTLPAYGEGDFEGQKQFYDYCASKINNGLDDILGDLTP